VWIPETEVRLNEWRPETDVPLNDPWKLSWLVARRRRRRADAALRRYRVRVRSASRSLTAAALSTLVAVAVGNLPGGSSASSGASQSTDRQPGAALERALPRSATAQFGGWPNPHPATLERIAQCESAGDPAAIGGGGLHRGKYQFTFQTWFDMGGRGDPALAPESEQDRRAAQLLHERGTAPWPNCA
jgi:hypothetical protein